MDVRDKRVIVVGLGSSGVAAARLLRAQGAQVVGTDTREVSRAASELAASGVELALGGHPEGVFATADLIVVSPGVPPTESIRAAEARGVPVVAEVELASWFVQSFVIGVTGTNGKSTVTSLIGEMCRETGRPTFVGGNLGAPFSEAPGTPAACADGIAAVELSSFQLERVENFHANVAVLLNVTEDHLDRYASFSEYAEAKAAIFRNQAAGDFAIVPSGDALCERLARKGRGCLQCFGGGHDAVRVEHESIVDAANGLRVPLRELRLEGGHNVTNACAAALAARLAHVPAAAIGSVLRRFEGLPHRMALVRTLDGVQYFDDSKATNVGAAVAALDGLGKRVARVVLIAGGRDKGGAYEPVRDRLGTLGRAVVLIGEAADRIEACLQGEAVPVVRAASLEEAVRVARGFAHRGDAVLLAPACSSYDMFTDYRHRGRVFENAVRALPPSDGEDA